ncbi:MAG: ABC transporter substrate-binding protein [Trueperaceae bacterium]
MLESKRKWTRLSLGLVLSLLMGLVLSTSAQTLVFSEANFIRSADPNNQFDLTDLYVYRHIYDPLVEILPGGEIGPMLADSWEVTDDGTEWTFHLREGVEFHNGEAFDAQDVAFTFQRIFDEELRQAFLVPSFESVQAVDDQTVVIRTGQPQGSFLNNLAFISILPSETVQEMGDAYFDERYGTGPFEFVEFQQDVLLAMERNENYWREGVPQLDRLEFRPIFEEATAQAALQTGEIDVLSAVSPDLAMVLEGADDVEVIYTPSIETTHLQVSLTNGPFNDPLIVEALNYAIDREAITEGLWLGEAIPAGAYVPPGLVGHHEGLEPFPYDPERSRQLLAEAGYPDGIEIELLGPAGLWPQSRQVMEAIQAQAAEAGFDINLNILESAAYVENRNAGNYELLYVSSIAVTHEGMRFLQERILEDVYNTGYENEEFTALMEELLTTIEPERQQELFEEVQELLYGAAPHIYLYYPPHIYAVRSEVENFVGGPDRSLRLWNVNKTE